jgi:hypothetical protein
MPERDRQDRIKSQKNGVSGTSSADFFHLAWRLQNLARAEAESLDGNTSMYVWAAIPMLLSGLTALVIEQEVILRNQRQEDRVAILLTKRSLVAQCEGLYGLSDPLRSDLRDLVELRNEIIHPAHTATGTKDNWPDEIRHIKNRRLLQSTGTDDGDYIMLSQLKSLRLLEWAVVTVEQTKGIILAYPR